MRLKITLPLLAILALLFCMADISEAQDMTDTSTLNTRQQAIVTIAAFTASGDMEQLTPALNQGLDAGLTISEIKEILVQMYAYAGFPRSLNGMFAFMGVLEERKASGIIDDEGRDATPVPDDLDRDVYGARVRADLSGLEEVPPPAPWQEFSPVIDDFLKQHLFADIFARDVLTHEERELATIGALANMTGTAGQLAFHLGAAMTTGLTETQMNSFIRVMEMQVDTPQAHTAREVLAKVLEGRQ